jgi:hypothetical protein
MSVRGGPDIVREGLILHLDAANDRSAISGSLYWYDLSKTGNNGLRTGSISYVSAGPLTYWQMGGMWYVGSPTYTPVSAFSYNAWVWWDFNSAGYRTIIDVANDRHGLVTNNMSLLLCCQPAIGANYNASWSTWTNVAATHANNGPVDFFINGQQTGTSGNFSNTHATNGYGIGAGANSYSSYDEVFTGRFSMISMYNRALSPREVRQNYHATKGRYGL